MSIEIHKNVLTEDQIKALLKVCGTESQIIYRGQLRTDIISYFSDFFNLLNVDRRTIAVRFYNTQVAFSVHSDGLCAQYDINYSLLVPLTWQPVDSLVHTIFFNQFDETPNHRRMGYKYSGGEIRDINKFKPITSDYSRLSHLTDEPFDIDLYNKWLSYINYDDLYGLTFHDAVKWSQGSVIKFESNRLHSSADFTTAKLFSKTHLLFKCYIPE